MRGRKWLVRAAVGAWLLGTAWAVDAADGIHRLTAAYPDFLVPATEPNTVTWKDGDTTTYNDGVPKATYDELLDKASLKDQLSILYPLDWPAAPPGLNEDPGRVRHEPFFAKMYGASRDEVAANLVDVPWPPAGPGETVRITRVNGVNEALGRVADEIMRLPDDVRRYAAEPVGTFNWRTIAGTSRRSMHAYGAAIDIELPDPAYRYWRWEPGGAEGTPAYPAEILRDDRLRQIVAAFEKHGFIWGGKWYHFDTMHFEYRPELLPGGSPRETRK